MIHDPGLLDRLDALPKETFDGAVFRGTRQSLDPLASSFSDGRWMRRDGAAVLALAALGARMPLSIDTIDHDADFAQQHLARVVGC